VGQLYSSGVWIAKLGHEAEFAAAWQEFASWSLSAIEGASWAVLLQDRPQSNRFVSFGPWDSLEAMAAWRANPGFAERVAEIRPLIERLAPSTLEAVAEVGTGPKSG